jgi:citrate synthase
VVRGVALCRGVGALRGPGHGGAEDRPAVLEEECRTLGSWWFEQEYMCRFLDAQTQAFTREEVDKAFTEEVEAWAL